MAAAKARKPSGNPARKPSDAKATSVRPTSAKELKPWQLGVFILLGAIVAGIFVGVGYAKKSHDDWGQWPWARTALPPQVSYDHRHFKDGNPSALPSGAVSVGKSPGGGAIFATSAAKTPVPMLVWVQDTKSKVVKQYSLSGGP